MRIFITCGDSFENLENADLSQKYSMPLSSAVDGHLSLPVVTGSVWPVQAITIKQKDENGNILSNGTAGNYHMAIKEQVQPGTTTVNPSDYKFIFEKQIVNNLSYIYSDTNPNTYFEYEKLKVSNNNGSDYDYEFQYLNSINNQNSYVPWNNASDDPLKLTLVVERIEGNPLSANAINILPFFGYDENGVSTVKVTSIVLESTDAGSNKIEEIITNPIVIGSTIVPSGVQNSSFYFHKKASIKFSQRNLTRATITFVQENPTDITIKHAYWTVSRVVGQFDFANANDDIEFGRSRTNPVPSGVWTQGARFNPALIVTRNQLSNVTGLDSAKNALMPTITNPELVNSSSSTKLVKFSGDTNLTYDYYVMKVLDKKKNKYVYIDSLVPLNAEEFTYEKTLKPQDKTIFVNWWPASVSIKGYEKLNASGSEVPKKFYTGTYGDPNDPKWEALMLPYASDPNYVPPSGTEEIPDSVFDWWKLKFRLNGTEKLTSYIGTSSPAYYLGELYNLSSSDIVSEKVQRTVPVKANYNVSLVKNFEILTNGQSYNGKNLDVKRWSIGIRDISIDSEIYQNSSELISKPFNFPYPIEYLMLYSDYSIPIEYKNNLENDIEPISYYISVDDSTTWLPISPVENPFNSEVPEIYAFNQNISSELRLPGVAYLDSKNAINSVRVRIVFKKPYNTNGTPLVNYYQLAAKVKRS